MQTSEQQSSIRPRIGIPVRLSSSEDADARVGEANELFDFIVELVRDAGAEPVLLDASFTDEAGRLATELRSLNGVLLPGGGDLDPRLYGEEATEACYDVNPDQDRLDLAVARGSLDAGLPTFGICRGHQLLNVVYGGSLIQDMHPSSVEHNGLTPAEGGLSTWAWHDVELSPGSKVAGLYSSRDSVRIASGHHQAVARVGDGLVVTAVAEDGTVEALEDPQRWVASVQWHPEASQLPDEERLAPFKAFVEVCRTLRPVG
ncbi:gamma-glutamyl-gamma-aminobutyrate hydrolase family protein [Arthrobacter sp. MMS24-S77]